VSQTNAVSLVGEGSAAARAGHKDEARRLLREATELDPDNEAAWLWLASVSETPQEAVVCLETVLDINPDNRQARAGLKTARLHAGIASARARDRRAARRHLIRVTEEDPANEAAWLWLASVGETPDEVVASLTRVLEINPENERARSGMAFYQAQAEPEEPAWACPLCDAPDEPCDDHCPGCGAVLSLANVEAFFTPDGPDPAVMDDAVQRLAPGLAQKATFEGHFYTALAYLNARRVSAAVPHLRSALQLKSADAGLRAQVRGVLQRHAAEEAAAQQRAAQQRAKQATVLCVDDSPTVRKAVAVTLEEAGHRVVTAGDGYEAVDLLRDRGVPDLILLDVSMPGMDGYELCKLLRHNEATRHVPVVMLSGKDGFFNKLRGQMAGSSEYLSKPFDPEQLVSVVARYCGVADA
jgi:twitching motility two-component system response regulator PilG